MNRDAINRVWQCGRYALPMGCKTLIMGIVNVTPDSFSGDGRLGTAAIEHALQLVADGADILDIGGESTRPGSQPVTVEEEVRRVLPVIEALAARVEVPLSVDTSKAVVARQALQSGASIINDIASGTFDAAMFPTLAESECGVVLMHLRGTAQHPTGGKETAQADVIEEVLTFWHERVTAAQQSGIDRDRIAVDAGFGFGKSPEENLTLIRRGRELSDFGLPILSATSRKHTIGKILGDLPVEERNWGTAATVALAIANGADIIRVHGVKALAQVAQITDAIVR